MEFFITTRDTTGLYRRAFRPDLRAKECFFKDGTLKRRAATSFLLYNKEAYAKWSEENAGSSLTNESYLRETPDYTTNPRPEPLNYMEQLLVMHIFDNTIPFTSEPPYVHLELLSVARDFATRLELCCLKPKKWISDSILNLVAMQLTNAQRSKHPDLCHTAWYFPVLLLRKMLKYPAPNERDIDKMCEHYLGDHQFTAKLSACKWIYLPLNHNNSHWICIKVDLVNQKTYLFDSMPRHPTNAARLNLARKVMGVLHHMLQRQFGHLYQHDVSKFNVFNLERQPLQHYTDTYDCGMFVIKFMRGYDYPHGVHLMESNERPRLIVDLVLDVNNRTVFNVLHKFDEWKADKGF